MKKVALFGSALLVAIALTGCKSDIQKAADEICDCKGDKKCMDDVQAKYKDKMGDGKKGDDMSSLSDKDKEAVAKMIGCMMSSMSK